MPRDFPIEPIVKPSDLAGATNGIIPADLLVDVGRRGSKMHHLAARGWRCLMWHFEQAGYRWDVASIDPRTYQRQCEMFDGRKYPGGRYLPQEMWATWEATGGKWGKRDNGSIQQYAWQAQDRTYTEQWRRMSQYAMAAIPGTSPHGWALAVDLATQLDDDEPAEGITEDQVRFLMADNLALNCGFAWSTVQEPWHLQWYVGDALPAFVVAWELRDDTPVDPTDPTSPIIPLPPQRGLELIAMYQIALTYGPGTLICRVTADRIIHETNGDAANVDTRAGVARVTVGWEEFIAMCRSRRTVGDPFQGEWYDANLAAAWNAAQS